MAKLVLSLPKMYGDHHVIRVRATLAALEGISEVRASAALRQVSVTFDAAKLSAEAITVALTAAGYAPGAAAPALPATDADRQQYVAAAEQAHDIPETKYAPPPIFGVCPGLEMRIIGGEHPADRKA